MPKHVVYQFLAIICLRGAQSNLGQTNYFFMICKGSGPLKSFKGISITCKDNIFVIKDKHDACPLLQMLAGFLQIGKNDSGHVLTLLLVSQ